MGRTLCVYGVPTTPRQLVGIPVVPAGVVEKGPGGGRIEFDASLVKWRKSVIRMNHHVTSRRVAETIRSLTCWSDLDPKDAGPPDAAGQGQIHRRVGFYQGD